MADLSQDISTLTTITLTQACSVLRIKISADETVSARVNVPGVHATGEYEIVRPGDCVAYAAPSITSFSVQGIDGTVAVDWSPQTVGIVPPGMWR